MRKLINPAPPVNITTSRKPPTVTLQIMQVDAQPLTQSQDKVNNLWSPDRYGEVALILEANFQAYDPETGGALSVTPEITWYLNQVKTWDGTNGELAIDDQQTSDVNYRLETAVVDDVRVTTGRLVVRQNIDYLSPAKVICIVKYTGIEGASDYEIEDSVLLTSENKPEEFYALHLRQVNNVKYRPLKDTTSQRTLEVDVYRGNAKLGASALNGMKFFWYKKESSDADWVLVPTTGLFPSYVSGQYTKTLVIDADCLLQCRFKVMAATTADAAEPNIPSFATCIVQWVLPDIEAEPTSIGGSSVSVSDTQRQFEAILRVDGKDISDADRAELIRLNWKSKPTNSATITDRGWTDSPTIAASELRRTGGENVAVWPEVYLLGPYEIITDDNDEPLIDDSGSATASDNGGYVIGRC